MDFAIFECIVEGFDRLPDLVIIANNSGSESRWFLRMAGHGAR
jgi:hypothetical protein